MAKTYKYECGCPECGEVFEIESTTEPEIVEEMAETIVLATSDRKERIMQLCSDCIELYVFLHDDIIL